MEVLMTVLQILLIASSLALIVVVLMQQTKSAGLGGAFGGDSPSFTSRGKAAGREVKLQKITKVLAIFIGVVAIAMAIFG